MMKFTVLMELEHDLLKNICINKTVAYGVDQHGCELFYNTEDFCSITGTTGWRKLTLKCWSLKFLYAFDIQ